MGWELYSSEQKDDFIAQINDENLHGLFKPEFMQIQALRIPFYRDAEYILLENLKIAPPFTMEYIKSGDTIVYLDGSPEPFDILNADNKLLLNETTAIDYLEFFCFAVNQRPHNILLLKNPDQMPYQDTIYLDFHFDKNNYTEKDIKLSRNEISGAYLIHAPFVFAGKIDLGIAHIEANGKIMIEWENPR